MLTFGDCELDLERYELRRAGVRVHLEPQVFDLLRYLLEHAGRVVAKEELLDAVWGDRFVSDTTVTTRIKEVRRAIGDSGEAQRWIRTIRRRGYEFVGPVGVGGAPARSEVAFCRGPDGVRIAYSASGGGRPLVKAANWLTHLGYDAQSPIWRHWIEMLSAGHTLWRYDERGCGLSDWELPEFTFEDWVTDLEEVVDAANLSRFPLVGISQGAAVAIAFAARHPERVERLILVGGYAAGRAVRARTADEQAAADLDVELVRVGWGSDDPALRRVFAMQFYPGGPTALWEAFDDLQRRTTSGENAVRFLTTFGRVDVRDLAPRVRCPTLVLHSREDRRVPFTCGQALADLLPDSRLVPLPSDNHLLTGDEPAWAILHEEVARFLDEPS